MDAGNYRLITDGFTWSYSKLTSFEDCPYKFFLKYFLETEDEPKFFASYGSFVHSLLEQYYNGKITKEKLPSAFIINFSKSVLGERPPEAMVQKYIRLGLEYFREFQPINWELCDDGVEKKFWFNVGGFKFVGIIDLLCKQNNELYIVDHKSRDLKPRSGRKTPTVKDKELDKMLRQLYLYSSAVEQTYKVLPVQLIFNCFKSKTLIKEQFDKAKYDEAIQWAIDTVNEIRDTTEFEPHIDYFYCNNLCGVNHECCYYQSVFQKGGR